MSRIRLAVSGLVLALVLAPAALSGQTYGSIGVGVAAPAGTLADFYDPGFTIRGQAGLSLVLVDIHVQTGYTSFRGKEGTVLGQPVTLPDIDSFHAGAGARLGLGFLWVGANAAYFFAEEFGKEIKLFPEAGLGLGPLEVVADYTLGDQNWLSLRLGWKL